MEDTIALRSIFQDCDGNNWRETWDNLNLDPCIYSEHYPGISCDLAWSNDFLRPGWYYRISQINLNSNKLSCKTFDFAGQTLKLLKVLDITLASGITEDIVETIISKAPNLEVLKLSGVLPYTNKTNRMISPSLVESAMRWSPMSRHRTSSPMKSILRQSSRGDSKGNVSDVMHTDGQKRHSSPPVRWADSRYIKSKANNSDKLTNKYSDTEINNKLRAWYYRHSYIVKWKAAYRKLHGIIASQAERNNDPEFTRNEMRLEQHRKELKLIGINEPLKMFQSRSLKPQIDMRLVFVPKKPKFVDFKEREYSIKNEDYTDVTTNLALEWTKTPKEAIRFHTPLHKTRSNDKNLKIENLELGWD
eukprot:g2050.t1